MIVRFSINGCSKDGGEEIVSRWIAFINGIAIELPKGRKWNALRLAKRLFSAIVSFSVGERFSFISQIMFAANNTVEEIFSLRSLGGLCVVQI